MPESYSIYDAKTNLSMIVRDSTERGKVFVIQNAQRQAAPRAVVLGETLFRKLLEHWIGRPEWEEDAEKGLWTVAIPETGIWGEGSSKAEAESDLVENAKALSEAYLEETELYLKFGKASALPLMLRISLAANDEELRQVLGL